MVGLFKMIGLLGKQELGERPAFRRAVYAILERQYPRDFHQLPAEAKALVNAIIDKEFQEGIPADPKFAADSTWLPLGGKGFYLME